MTLQRALPLAVILLLILPTAAGAQGDADGAGEVVVEAPRQVTGNTNQTRLMSIPALAVHPDDPSTVVMAAGDSRHGGCGLWVSRDGGLSWDKTIENLLPEDRADLSYCYQRPLFQVMEPVFAPDGTLHVAFPGSGAETDGPITMLATRTDDLGATHDTVIVSEADTVTADPGDFGQEGEPAPAVTWHKAPSLVVNPTNPEQLFLGMRWNVWGTDSQSFEGDVPFRPWLAVSDDGGQSWNEPIDIVENASGEDVYGALHHEMVATPDGELYSFTRSWPAPDSDSGVQLLMMQSSDSGQSWEITPFLEDIENFRAPVAAADPRNGDLYVVYSGTGDEETAEGEAPAPHEIFFSASRDGGQTWSDPVQLTQAPEEPAESLAVNISVAPDGRIDVAWHDFRNDPFGPGQVESFFRGERYWDVYYAYSTDEGQTWSDNLRVTETFIDGGQGATYNNKDVRGPTGLASTNDGAYIAWPDTRPSSNEAEAEDVYLSRVRFTGGDTAALSGAAGAADGSPWLWGLLGAGAALALGGLLLLLGIRRARPQPNPAAQT